MRPMRIAFIGQRGLPATVGGIEHHVEEIGARLVARGHQVTVFSRGNYAAEPVAEHRGMTVRNLPTVPTKRLEALVHSGLSTLAAMLPGSTADILHFHAIGPSVFTPLPRFITRRRVVLTIHGLDHDRSKWGPGARACLRGAGWISAHVPHATISVSRNLVDHYRERYGRVVHYIPNGVSLPVFRRPRLITERWGLGGDDYILFLGRLVPEKAPDLLLRAFQQVDSPVRLVIAGGSSYTNDYASRLEALAAADPRVVMTGPVQGQLREELYSNATAFVLPSTLEGLPLTLLEAAAYGLPVVVSDIPPHIEVIGKDSAGARLFRGQDAAALTLTLRRVLAGRELERAGAEDLARRVLRDYDWDAATDALEELYKGLVAVAPRRRVHDMSGRPAATPPALAAFQDREASSAELSLPTAIEAQVP
jgi:glycosyltransferase involved in cell wall biosynthesis